MWKIILLIVSILVIAQYGNGRESNAVKDYEKELVKVVSDFLQKENDTNLQALKNKTPHPYVFGGGLLKEFPCHRMGPSNSKPESVHELRPADINVVAALGDSLTAGKAAGSKGMSAVLFDYRGLSWSIGGDGNFDTLHSLPNILREYNPDLYGFSNSIGNLMSNIAHLNVAKSGATSDGLAFQAALLIQRLINDPNVDYHRDWKVITILIGANDLCQSCKAMYNPRHYINRIKSALDILHNSVPRAFINLLEIMPVELARFLPRGAFCRRIESFYCPCAVNPKSENQYEQLIKDREEYQRLTEELVNSGRYEDRDDFTVVLQPLYKNGSLQLIPGTEDIDYSLYAVDCFHHSIKGHSHAGLGLWNNMLQPLDQKSTDWSITNSMLCPTDIHPFLATAKNSQRLHEANGLIRHSWLRKNSSNTSATKAQTDHQVPSDRLPFRNSNQMEQGLNPGSSVWAKLFYIPNLFNNSLTVFTIQTEPDTWQIWYDVLGWTLLMSALLAFCVTLKNWIQSHSYHKLYLCESRANSDTHKY